LIYAKTITEPAGGDAANPSQYILPVTRGLVYQFELYLPPGSSGLLRVAVDDGGHRLWPSEPGEFFFGDNITISFQDNYFVKSDPHSFFVYAYNLDTEYEHEFQVRIGQASDPVFIQSMLPSIQMESFTEDIAALVATQDQSRTAMREQAVATADAIDAEAQNGVAESGE